MGTVRRVGQIALLCVGAAAALAHPVDGFHMHVPAADKPITGTGAIVACIILVLLAAFFGVCFLWAFLDWYREFRARRAKG
jgi:hypothetical protein